MALTDRPAVVLRTYRDRLQGGGPEAYDHLGLVQGRQGNYPAAEENFRRAAAGDPGNVLFLSDLGSALFHQGKMEEAKEVLLRSVQIAGEKSYSYPHYYLGEIYREEGDAAAGYREYQKAVAAFPAISEAHYQLALMLAGDETLGEADYHFGRAAKLRGDFSSALRSFGRAQARLGSDPIWTARIAEELWQMQ
jgi:tetratricopeptide (TPR) repeat protein